MAKVLVRRSVMLELGEREAELKKAEALLARDPRSGDALFARARALDDLGRNEEARQAYVEVLTVQADHLGALTALATLAVKLGQRGVAKTALAQVARARPDSAVAHANLATILCDDGDLAAAREHYETALRLDPEERTAHRGLAIVLLRLGERDAARHHGRLGFQGRADAWPYRGSGQPVSMLILLSAAGGNTPIEQFADDRVFRKWTLAPEFFDPDVALPPHDLVFNAIGDVELCGEALDMAAVAVDRSRAPVLNTPSRIRLTDRAANAARLGRIPGVVTARVEAWSRDSLASPGAANALAERGFALPVLLRSPGFHAGAHFVKVDRPEELPRAVEGLPGSTLLVMSFLDTRGHDGKFRKCRAMAIDGRLYPVHLAVSRQWKVHYFSADMPENADHRAEDEAFLQDMSGTLGPRAMRALEAVAETMGLDYGGIDFALDRHGDVVVFEANAAMAVLTPTGDPRWDYRAAPIERVHDAVRRMLLSRAGRPAAP